ncbi:MAG: MarR family transcriptional regulator [Alphaproteobacteria bacterium]|nr:MarR family transcriptional regulator [Alphaproteobacteria bacterium]MCB9795137.1 MarR family transcriptional regulator [Alphaproteobacteria bacterium]
MQPEIATWVEDVALFWEAQGLPRIAGRILGWLMICEPPHRTPAQLAEELGASKSSISTMTRLLEASGTIERVAVPGERASYFALTPEGLERKFTVRVAAMTGFVALADAGLALAPGATARLEVVRAMYAFIEREMPALLERWQAERAQLVSGKGGGWS